MSRSSKYACQGAGTTEQESNTIIYIYMLQVWAVPLPVAGLITNRRLTWGLSQTTDMTLPKASQSTNLKHTFRGPFVISPKSG